MQILSIFMEKRYAKNKPKYMTYGIAQLHC